MPKELNVTVSDGVYEDLQRELTRDEISHIVEMLVRSILAHERELDRDYLKMGVNISRECSTTEWIEAECGEALEAEINGRAEL
jgi:hypothetical protein